MKREKKGKKAEGAVPNGGKADESKPWDPPEASFADGVALIESLFGGEGDGETFSAFIQCVSGPMTGSAPSAYDLFSSVRHCLVSCGMRTVGVMFLPRNYPDSLACTSRPGQQEL